MSTHVLSELTCNHPLNQLGDIGQVGDWSIVFQIITVQLRLFQCGEYHCLLEGERDNAVHSDWLMI